MSISGFKRLAIVLGVFCAVLLVASGFLYWCYGWLHIQTAMADDQTHIFDDMRTQALQSAAPHDISRSLEYVVFYYPSGTKQKTGSRLDRVVERHRTAVVREIIAHLRRTTGQDLGDNPEPWIQKYEKK
jgi:hypothetical protein